MNLLQMLDQSSQLVLLPLPCKIGESAIVYLLLLSHTQTVGQKWLLKQPRGSLHQIQDPMAVSIQVPFNKLFFSIAIPATPKLDSHLQCVSLKTSSQYYLANMNLILPGLTHSTKEKKLCGTVIWKLLNDGPFTLGDCHHSL